MKIFRKILFFVVLLFCLNLSPYKCTEEKMSYNGFRDPAVQRFFNSDTVNQQIYDQSLNNTLSSLYFSNLRQNIPFNMYNSCGYVALSMYLSFLDTTYNDNIIPEHLESKSSQIEIVQQNNGPSDDWYSLDHQSPGVVTEDLSIVNNMNLNTYLNLSSSLKNTYFHSLLVDIFKTNSMFSHSNNSLGLSYNGMKSLISTYFNQYLSYSPSMYNVTEGRNSESLYQYVRSKVFNGIPVIVFIENNEMNHIGVAYNYDPHTLEIFVHSGWKNEQGEAVNKLIIKHGYETVAEDFKIKDAITIELNQTYHTHIYNYIDNNSSGFCACEFLVPSFVNVTNLYVDSTPQVTWFSFYQHPTFENLNCHFEIYISSNTQNVIQVLNYSDNEYYLDYDVWLSLVAEFESEILDIHIKFKCNSLLLERETILFYDLDYDSEKALLITSSDYNNGADFPNFLHTNNDYLICDIQSSGIQISSTYIVLNPSLSNLSSLIHYYFDKEISRFDLNIGFVGSTIPSTLYNNATLFVQIYKEGQWITYFDLLQANLFEIEVGGNTSFIPIYFYDSVDQIKIKYQIYDESTYNTNLNLLIKPCTAYSKEVHTNADANEMKYEPNLWNIDLSYPTNCYAYALNDPALGFLQLGSLSHPGSSYLNYPGTIDSGVLKSCLVQDVTALGKGIQELENEHSPCLHGGYRIGLFAPEDCMDFHFYRQNKDGTRSHKMGATAVTNRDSDGNIIYNPMNCARHYTYYYEKIAFYEIYDL